MRKKSEIFDVIVVGAGSGGLNIAGFMNRVGLRVLLIDKEDRAIGGDCLNYGCVPSKALIHVARLIRDGKEASEFGLNVSGEVDFRQVMRYVSEKKEFIREHENAEHFRKLGMTVVLGLASFVDHETVEVSGVHYRGKKIILATGSRPRKLNIPGIESAEVRTNETLFALDRLPGRMVVIGTGPIGIEIGQAMSIFGSKVTVVGPKLLEREDSDMVGVLQDALLQDGMEFSLDSAPVEVKNGNVLVIKDGEGVLSEIPFDMLFVSIGREIDTSKLGLGAAGIETREGGGVAVNEYLETTNKRVLVCGDVAGGYMFTHAAELHASVIINNFFSPLKKKLNTDAMAWVTYTSPEIATFGLSEKTLKDRSVSYEVIAKDFSDDDRAIVDGYTNGKVKLFISKKSKVLGGTMAARNAGELAQELMLAQSNGLTLKAFMKKVYPYPTAARVNRSLVLAHMSKKLTESSKRILRFLFH